MIKFVTADEEVPRKRSDTTQTNFCENCGLCELSTAPYSHKGDGYGEVQLHAEQCVAVYDALRLDASDPRRNRKVKVPDGRPKSGQFYKGRD